MHKLFDNRSGFTIVELLVVVSIIGVISALVVVSYSVYRKNAENAQAATDISAYQSAVSTTVNENGFVATGFAVLNACISSTSDASVCCFLSDVNGSGTITYTCSNNTTIGNFSGYTVAYTASTVSSWVRTYLKNLPPSLPANSKVAACATPGATYVTTLACSTREVGLVVYIMSDGSIKSFLHYYLPSTIDCQSSNVATVSTSSGGMLGISYDGAKYTARITTGATPFTFCVVGIQ